MVFLEAVSTLVFCTIHCSLLRSSFACRRSRCPFTSCSCYLHSKSCRHNTHKVSPHKDLC
ncbi:hypothetical protein PF010_g1056 [Phytophthora fragariae]|uniref:Secreted protein n=1 Tax=Phytophthora fragariae TaxID=53985 RepID=A0A6A3UV78_9STRA|nr:hypothetical protein PF003_g25971 [Phytophthora fragariae]KAE8949105.1 hypothetical protein PF009_g1352 [Phytophthora fragariae]KAE9138097.1 hypothetical protein PF010_g1056 [Phytophthora fragariae]KAE9138802.1 hypothetical protein PF007_g1254 [Phytophthora fragariae]KAE9154939.1 hypothetical protein PF006_g1059 [Phytophthora fragariae]